MSAYRTSAQRPLPTLLVRSSASVTVTMLGLGVPTLALGIALPLHTVLASPTGDAPAQLALMLVSAVLLGIVAWIAVDRWPTRASLAIDGNSVVVEWRRGGRVLNMQRLAHADLVDVVLEKSSTTVDHAGECDLLLCTRAARISLGFHASFAACEEKATEVRQFLWSAERWSALHHAGGCVPE